VKSNASKKVSKLRNERNRTGNFPVTTDGLDNLQKHIISCISLEDVGGSRECADTPEEEDISFCLYCAVSVNFYVILEVLVNKIQ